MDQAELIRKITGLSKKIAALRRRQSSNKEWGYGRAVALQSLEKERAVLLGKREPFRLIE